MLEEEADLSDIVLIGGYSPFLDSPSHFISERSMGEMLAMHSLTISNEAEAKASYPLLSSTPVEQRIILEKNCAFDHVLPLFGTTRH